MRGRSPNMFSRDPLGDENECIEIPQQRLRNFGNVRIEDKFEESSGPQDVKLEGPFKQENDKQLPPLIVNIENSEEEIENIYCKELVRRTERYEQNSLAFLNIGIQAPS